jgi:catechol 2,3-dioxygenase-like lactoylglutathione lyase family enzyme
VQNIVLLDGHDNRAVQVAQGDRVTFDVGGVLLDRPFRIARLGHVGLNVDDVTSSVGFYRDLLGFSVADTVDFTAVLPPQVLPPEVAATMPETSGYFMRYGSDHHSFVLFPKCVMSAVGRGPASVTINQLTWQVGSLRQVVDGRAWLEAEGVQLTRSGRDMPGSNWNVYFLDPDGHINELYYGMEQIGWDGLSKPAPMHDRIFREAPGLPQPAEQEEVEAARAAGIDLASGTRAREQREFAFDVDGVTLARPFKVIRLGPIGLFVDDVDVSTAFYENVLGFSTTEESDVGGHRSRYLRANTEHHCLALLPTARRDELGLSPETTTAWIGLQVATYRQLRDALAFFRAEGLPVRELPEGVVPGIDYGAWVFDPAGHAFLLYFGMEQIGADGRLGDTAGRPSRATPWPETIGARPYHYGGEPFLGPWG